MGKASAVKAEDLREFVEELTAFRCGHKDLLDKSDRIRRSLDDALQAARARLEDSTRETC